MIKRILDHGVRCVIKSPWVLHYNSGSCNGCDIEILDILTPRHDVERFGILLKGSPRLADVLLVTGPVTLQSRDALITIWNQMAEPKFCVAVGTCACTGGVFKDCFSTFRGVHDVIPVHAYVAGCPPRPEAIIAAAVALLQSLDPGAAKAAAKETEVEVLTESEVKEEAE